MLNNAQEAHNNTKFAVKYEITAHFFSCHMPRDMTIVLSKS